MDTDIDRFLEDISDFSDAIFDDDIDEILDALGRLAVLNDTYQTPPTDRKSEKRILKSNRELFRKYNRYFYDTDSRMCPRCSKGYLFFQRSPVRLFLVENFCLGQTAKHLGELRMLEHNLGKCFQKDPELYHAKDFPRIDCAYCGLLSRPENVDEHDDSIEAKDVIINVR